MSVRVINPEFGAELPVGPAEVASFSGFPNRFSPAHAGAHVGCTVRAKFAQQDGRVAVGRGPVADQVERGAYRFGLGNE